MSHPPHPKQLKECENCGTSDDLWYYEYVFNGITLCEDCAGMPYSKVSKKQVDWIEVDNERFPANLNKKLCKKTKH